VRHSAFEAPESATADVHRLRLSLAVMEGAGWRAEDALDAARRAAAILAQCAIVSSLELYEFEGPRRFRSLNTPVSRELAQRLGLPRPAVFFIAETLQHPAFDAEAVGRGNSRSRPEMADTVWVVSGVRDLPVVIAHELVHVLSDSGAHSTELGNLMRDETSPGSTGLSPAQCTKLVATASANGLLRPSP